MTSPARPRTSGAGTSNGSNGRTPLAAVEDLADLLLVIGRDRRAGRVRSRRRIVRIGRGSRRRVGDVISEPDDAGGPDEGHPAALEDAARAHRDHARTYRTGALRFGCVVLVADLAIGKAVADARVEIDALGERAAEGLGDLGGDSRIDVAPPGHELDP